VLDVLFRGLEASLAACKSLTAAYFFPMFGFIKLNLDPLSGSRSVFIVEPGSGSRFNEYGTADKYTGTYRRGKVK
jgi:hypothetical protein